MLTYTSTADRYTVSGSSYTINFPYWKETEVKAVVTLSDGTLQDLVLNTDYSVSTPNGNNGTLTKLTAWTDADKLTIYRDSAKTQEVDLVQGQKINADTIENSLDHSVAIMQELQEKLSRTIASSIDEAGTDIEFPGKTARAGNLLGFDATGENIAFRNLAQFDTDVANTAANATAAANSATLASKWAENPVDTPVVSGQYSAKHWASKASTSAGSASVSAYNADQSALDSEAYAIGKRNGSDVPATDPAYHNNTKYYYDLVVGAISGALRYQGTWTTTGATDYSGISTPRSKGDLFYCQGTACTIDGVTYTQGDLIIFNNDVADGGTITTSVIDKIDNTETVTPDNSCTLSNKTIAFGSNTMTDVASTNTTQTLTNKTIDSADNTLNIDREDVHRTYSTSEVKTGDEWTDGKPIYRLTLDIPFTSMSGASPDWYYDISSLNIDTPVESNAFVQRDDDRLQSLPVIAFGNGTTISAAYSISYIFQADKIILSKGGSANVTKMYATIWYTKTTD